MGNGYSISQAADRVSFLPRQEACGELVPEPEVNNVIALVSCYAAFENNRRRKALRLKAGRDQFGDLYKRYSQEAVREQRGYLMKEFSDQFIATARLQEQLPRRVVYSRTASRVQITLSRFAGTVETSFLRSGIPCLGTKSGFCSGAGSAASRDCSTNCHNASDSC